MAQSVTAGAAGGAVHQDAFRPGVVDLVPVSSLSRTAGRIRESPGPPVLEPDDGVIFRLVHPPMS